MIKADAIEGNYLRCGNLLVNLSFPSQRILRPNSSAASVQ